MRTHHYPSDVTDAQWALIEPHLPPEPGGGRPRKTAMRDVFDAILYVLRTGRQWRYLPGDLPPKSTVWRSFDRWRSDGTLDTIHDLLRKKVRTAEKPCQPRTTASVDSRSVDTTSGGEAGGRGNAKNVDVHYSSGIGNHFFYLLAEGSGAKTLNGVSYSSPTCNGSTVTGIGRDAAQRIWYRALTTYMTSNTNYKGARTATLNAAKDLYGATSTQYTTVAAAWSAVSVS